MHKVHEAYNEKHPPNKGKKGLDCLLGLVSLTGRAEGPCVSNWKG